MPFKEAKLLAPADGLMLHYTLSDEENGLVLLLLRAVSDALDAGVELSGTHGDALPMRDDAEEALPDLETLIAKPLADDPKLSAIVFKTLGRHRCAPYAFLPPPCACGATDLRVCCAQRRPQASGPGGGAQRSAAAQTTKSKAGLPCRGAGHAQASQGQAQGDGVPDGAAQAGRRSASGACVR
jgi:hypothetical protein